MQKVCLALGDVSVSVYYVCVCVSDLVLFAGVNHWPGLETIIPVCSPRGLMR